MSIIKRWQEKNIINALKLRRVIVLSGARQCGKSTLVKNLPVKNHIYRALDSGTLLEAAIASPESFVEHGNELMIIDEIQRAPQLLLAIKKNVDENQNNGRFLLTGSANIQSSPLVNESLAGRVTNIRLRTFAQAELIGEKPNFIPNAFNNIFNIAKGKKYKKNDYLSLAFIGGYPEVIKLSGQNIRRWHSDYIKALIDRDLKDIINIRRKSAMMKLLKILASWSTKQINIQAIGANLSIDRLTIDIYISALESLFLVDRIAAWANTDYIGVRKKDKLIMSDSGLMASILRWNLAQIEFDGEKNGKLIETFVYNQLIANIEAQEKDYELFYYRDSNKREIDFLIENENGDLLAIEVKGGTAVSRKSFKHLKWFRDSLVKKQKFIGVILYMGDEVLSFGENLWAVPINSLWA